MTSHPFEDALLRLGRAQEHVSEFDTLLRKHFADDPWKIVIEPDVDRTEYVHKLKFGPSPDKRLKALAADAFGNLRSALDHATAACARANGGERDRLLQFPFAGSPSEWDKLAKMRCSSVPQPVIDYFRTRQPFSGGDERLYALARVRNDNEHWEMTPTTLTAMYATVERAGRCSEPIELTQKHGAPHEVELFRTQTYETDYRLEYLLAVRFPGIPAFSHAEPSSVFRYLVEKVTEILNDVGAIMRGLKLFP